MKLTVGNFRGGCGLILPYNMATIVVQFTEPHLEFLEYLGNPLSQPLFVDV